MGFKVNMIKLHVNTPQHIVNIANKPITFAEMSIVNNHVALTIQFGKTTLHAMSFYEEDNNILFNIVEPEYKDIIIKYTNDVGILSHAFINQYINSHPNFFTSVYVFEQVHFDGFTLPINSQTNDDGMIIPLAERFDDALHDDSPHYIEIIERVDGDLSSYPYNVSLQNLQQWSTQLWNMYSYLHFTNITYDDIKPNNIGYIIDNNNVYIKMIDLESLRKVSEDYTINLLQSGVFKPHKYYSFNTYKYDSVDILSMIFALFNVIYKSDAFNYCDRTLSQLLGFDCSAIEKHFFNFSDMTFCSNWKFCLMMFTICWMTVYFQQTQRFGLNSFYNFLVNNDIPDRFAWIIANVALYIYMYSNGMLTLRPEEGITNKVPSNLQKVFKNYSINESSPIEYTKLNESYSDILAIVARDLHQVFDNYREFIIKCFDYGTLKYLATCVYK